MESFWDVAKLLLLVGIVLAGLMLLALLNPRLRKLVSAIFFTITAILGVYVVSPIDFLPDFIPLLGQLDDVLATALAVVNGISGIILYLKGRSSPPEPGDGGRDRLPPRR
jgi:uncharacterized membrane protein YkvA (DUF1232 family)